VGIALLATTLCSASGSSGAPRTQRCDRYHSFGDASARINARTAQTAAETYATDHNGEYAGMSAAKLHAIEPSLSITRRHAMREHERAYLLTARGGADAYLVTARALTGDTYTIARTSDGAFERVGHECGIVVHW
jgi:hypothetical protein